MRENIQRIWAAGDGSSKALHWHDRLLSTLLTPVGYLYGSFTGLRNRLYDANLLSSRRLPLPTVSVGNISVGGTGKTPFVERCAELETERGRRVAILSRGYGSPGSDPDTPDDEMLSPRLQDRRVKRFVHPDRLTAGQEAIDTFNPDLLLLDDGFQHRRMERDLDIVLVDGLRGFGNGNTLPAGPLREPLSGLRRADMAVITRTNRLDQDRMQRLQNQMEAYLPDRTPVLYAVHRPAGIYRYDSAASPEQRSRKQLRNHNLLAFCGIGTPESFRHTLRDDLDLNVDEFHSFPDHHTYPASDREKLIARAQELDAEYLITTRKDAVKWPDDVSPPLLYVDVELEIVSGEQILRDKLGELVSDTGET